MRSRIPEPRPAPPWQVLSSLLDEVAIMRRRLAYIASHGEPWSQSVARGDKDDALKPAANAPASE